MSEKKQCTGNVSECFKCRAYWCSHSPHYETVNGEYREVVTIDCSWGTGGIFDADSGERIRSY